jgi:hypothetical protein
MSRAIQDATACREALSRLPQLDLGALRSGVACSLQSRGAEIHRELKRKHVTLTMLWDEYIERCPEAVSLFALLRAVPQLGIAIVGHDAASPHRRR